MDRHGTTRVEPTMPGLVVYTAIHAIWQRLTAIKRSNLSL